MRITRQLLSKIRTIYHYFMLIDYIIFQIRTPFFMNYLIVTMYCLLRKVIY